MPQRSVVFVVFPDALLLDLSGPLAAFELSCETAGREPAPYRLTVASVAGGLVRTSSGLELMTRSLAEVGEVDTLLVVGGPGVHEAAAHGPLLQWLTAHAAQVRRVCSVCTGTFVLAAAGLLAGRRVVTHWGSCKLLQDRYPQLTVSPDAIYERDGPVWTSAGVTAGIDLALALIEDDRGHGEAIRVAKRLVVFLKRAGGQTQFSVPLALQEADDAGFEGLHRWISDHLMEDLRVEVLAERASMSPRTFARLYAARTGRTPAKVVEELRLDAARRALEETRQSIKEIATRCGFVDEERMRRAFRRQLGVSPQDYRDKFGAAEVGRFPSS
ncbi:GlxA family transcriptional regulator [Aquabacter cavernae]|uniref:GlxA family transcriptional regulator n=1 Tax=Aquabacter cavernae TaxID=2496029 RepID=UPI000F8EBA76|nr:GlxA family transcriptional regulator [Aquabacter cavernae]